MVQPAKLAKFKLLQRAPAFNQALNLVYWANKEKSVYSFFFLTFFKEMIVVRSLPRNKKSSNTSTTKTTFFLKIQDLNCPIQPGPEAQLHLQPLQSQDTGLQGSALQPSQLLLPYPVNRRVPATSLLSISRFQKSNRSINKSRRGSIIK